MRLSTVFVAGALLALGTYGVSQSLTTGAVSGSITDQAGKAVTGAKITATDTANGVTRTAVSGDKGDYLLPLLEPGTYRIEATKSGFETARETGVTVAIGGNINVNIKLAVGAASQTVEVNTEAPLIEPQNPNTTTVLTQAAIQDVPNPGNDITFLAQVSPGAQIAKGGGSAGLTINGVAGATIEYTMDGLDVNTPFNDNNRSGPSNLGLGLNQVSEMSVNTNAYDVADGRMAAAQITYLSKSGGNDWHGNLQYQWNGRVLNAYDTFTKMKAGLTGTTIPNKPFDNVNNWAGGVGGPIIKNKLFFFFDNEGARIDLPVTATATVPSPTFETYALQQIALGGCDTSSTFAFTSATAPAAGTPCVDTLKSGSYNYEKFLPAEASLNGGAYSATAAGINEEPFLNQIFRDYGQTALGTYGQRQIIPNTTALTGCNINYSAATGTYSVGTFNPQLPYTSASSANNTNPIPNGTGCANSLTFSTSNTTPETLTSGRMDYTMDTNDTFWWRFENDQGRQATSTSAIGPLFNETSYQPEREGTADYTHTFSPTLANDFTPGFWWNSAIFVFGTPAAESAAIGGLGSFGSPFTTLGSQSFPQGRNTTHWQLVDNISWTHGTHAFKFGENFRRDDVNDHNLEEKTTPSATAGDYAELMYGVATASAESFPQLQVQPIRDWALDLYAGDTWQVMPKLTLNIGLRGTHNSDVADPFNQMGLVQDWNIMNHSVAGPLNTVISGTGNLWTSVPAVIWQPRIAAAYQVRPNTLFKAGWGMFSTIVADSTVDSVTANPPFDPSFTAGFGSGNLGAAGTNGTSTGSVAGCTSAIALPGSGLPVECGSLYQPGYTYSASAAVAAANAAFQTAYPAGGTSCAFKNQVGCVPVIAATVLPSNGLEPPLTYQYSAGVTQQLNHNLAVTVSYVGTRTTHISYTVDPNGYQSVCSGCFSPWPFAATAAASPDPRFSTFSQNRYAGWSRYDSLQTSVRQRLTHGFSYNLNYTWAHCLSTGTPWLDTTGLSNPIADTYRDCATIDVRNTLNGDYTYVLPFHAKGATLGKLVNDWQVSGTTFSESGSPVFVSSSTNGSFVQTSSGSPNPATPVAGINPYSIGTPLTGVSGIGTYQWFNPAAFYSIWDNTTKLCVNPATGTDIAANTVAACQYPAGTNTITLRGPLFNWTNFYLTKSVDVTERIKFRFDAQFYNLFNHPNYSTPSLTGIVNGQPGTLSNDGSITSLTSPATGLLGEGLGGDTNPRMIAFQGKFVF